jgi:secretion/DNA translocation related TadE-like protein
VAIVGLLGVASLLLVGLLAVGGAVAAQRRAQSAADLGALAGAAAIPTGEEGCARAEVIVRANGGAVATCRVEGPELALAVRVTPRGAARAFGAATARARAGPERARND